MDRKLRHNFIFNLITQILTVLTPLVISPYISRVLDVELIGSYNYCYSIVSIFGLFANMGISAYGIPIIAKSRDSIEERSKAFWELLMIKFVFAVLSIMVYVIFIFTVFDLEYRTYFYIFGFYILSVLLDISWFFQALENFKIICIRTLIVKLISFVCIFSFVKSKADMNLYILINMLALVIPNLLLFYSIKKEIVVKRYKLQIKNHLKPIVQMILPGIAYTLYAMIDRTMIKVITGGTIEVGYYEQAYKLSFVGVTIISVFGTVLSTRISALTDDEKIKQLHKYSYAVISIITIPIFIGFLILADYFIPFYYGVGYEGAISILKIFSVLPFVMGISNFVSYQYFIPKIITKPSMIIVISAIIINIILNLVFIRICGGLGAAIATIISESFISILYLWFYAKYQKISVVLKTTYKYFISGAITLALMYIINMWYICNTFLIFILYVGIILILFFGCIILLRDEITLKILNMIISKLRRNKNVQSSSSNCEL